MHVTLQWKLFWSSVFVMFQAINQLALYRLMATKFPAKSCVTKIKDYLYVLNVFFFFDRYCRRRGDTRILDLMDKDILSGLDEKLKLFLSMLNEMETSSKIEANILHYLMYVWVTVDLLLIMASLPLFCSSFCPGALGKNVFYFIVIPFVIIVIIAIISDIFSLILYIDLSVNTLTPSNWAYAMGIPKEQANSLIELDVTMLPEIQRKLWYFPLFLLYLCSRQIIGIPAFIMIVVVTIKYGLVMFNKNQNPEDEGPPILHNLNASYTDCL